MPPRNKIDFTHYEPQYPFIFGLLRNAGWRPDRDVDFPDVDQDAEGENRGHVVLLDPAECFLRSFYGLQITANASYGLAEFLIGFGPQWQRMDIGAHGTRIDWLAKFDFPYPILCWGRYVGFLTDHQKVLAVNDTYQVCIRAQDPFQLMEWIIDRQPRPGIEIHYLEYDEMPYEYWHLTGESHPLEFHLRQYDPYQLTEAGETHYVLEDVRRKSIEIRVIELMEQGEDLFLKYQVHAPHISPSIAREVIVHRLLDEWLGGLYRTQTKRIHFENTADGSIVTVNWPERRMP